MLKLAVNKSLLDAAVLLNQRIICRRNPSQSSDHLFHLGPKRLLHEMK